jgi:Tol biopolymer transport system component
VVARWLSVIGAFGLVVTAGWAAAVSGKAAGVIGASLPAGHAPRHELAFFTTHGNAVYDLGIADDLGRHRRVVTGESRANTVAPQLFTQISWSPGGRRLTFAGGRGPERSNIYTIGANGSRPHSVTHVANAGDPLFSPDGKAIFFTRVTAHRRGVIRGSLWSVGSDGSRLRLVAKARDRQLYTAGSFTPNGSRLAVTRATLDPKHLHVRSRIEVMRPNGSHHRPLIRRARDPSYSPDGTRIAFASGRDHNGRLCYGDQCFAAGELYVANVDGSRPERLTSTHDLNEAHPSWLPDGSRIAYQRGKVFENAEAISILEMNPDGSCAQTILAGSGPGHWYSDPAWRPTPSADGGPLSC